jgi:hypothetical protein
MASIHFGTRNESAGIVNTPTAGVSPFSSASGGNNNRATSLANGGDGDSIVSILRKRRLGGSQLLMGGGVACPLEEAIKLKLNN